MKRWLLVIGIGLLVLGWGFHTEVTQAEALQEAEHKEQHNWEIYSEDYHEMDAGTHDFSYWKNLMRYNRTCVKTHIIRTVVYYCAKHDHTKSEIFLHETKHSLNHGE